MNKNGFRVIVMSKHSIEDPSNMLPMQPHTKSIDAPPEHQVELQVGQLSCPDFS